MRVRLLNLDASLVRAIEHHLARRGGAVCAVNEPCDCLIVGEEAGEIPLQEVGWQLTTGTTKLVVFVAQHSSMESRLRASNLGSVVDQSVGVHGIVRAAEEAVTDALRPRDLPSTGRRRIGSKD